MKASAKAAEPSTTYSCATSAGAGFAADAYARLTGKLGVCDATVGPGATNLLSPLAEAHCSSIPLLAVISDIPRSWEHRRVRGNASQAMEQLEMFKPVSKWQVTLSDPASLENVVDQAIRVAVSGRPGPVVLAVPDDVGDLDIEWPRRVRPSAAYPRHRSAPDPAQVQAARQALIQAKKPVLLAGGGVHTAGGSGRAGRPGPQAGGAGGHHHHRQGGHGRDRSPGVRGHRLHGQPPRPTRWWPRPTLVFFIACKAGQLATFGYDRPAPGVATIHLDIDPEEIGRNFPESIPLVGDARLGLADLLYALEGDSFAYQWDLEALRQCLPAVVRGDHPAAPDSRRAAQGPGGDQDDRPVHAARRSGGVRRQPGLGLGRGLPAPQAGGPPLPGPPGAWPAWVGGPRRRWARPWACPSAQRVFLFAGDGGFAFSLQELEVMVRLKLPVVTCLFNNNVLAWIKHVQKARYGDNHISTDFHHIDFATVAQGFGARSYRVSTLDELSEALTKESQPQGPALIDMTTDQFETPVLRNASGKA